MTIAPSSVPLMLGPGYRVRLTRAGVLAVARRKGAKRMPEVERFVATVFGACRALGINPDAMIGMSAHETDLWRSARFEKSLNPAGLGSTDDGAWGLTFPDGRTAALAMGVHLAAYAVGDDAKFAAHVGLDPRYRMVDAAGYGDTVETLAGLGNGRWASDPDYAAKVAKWIAEMAAEEEVAPMPASNMRKGLVPLPEHNVVPFEQGVKKKVEGPKGPKGRGYDHSGPRHLDGLCFHRSQGGGSVGWLLRSDVAGLTDWVINPKTALMTQINFLTGTDRDVSGWAQGPINPTVMSDDVRTFLAEHGGNYDAWNAHIESIEVEEFYDDPMGEQCRKDLAQWTASRAHDHGITYDRFPLRPNGQTFIYGHREACGVAYKPCPGSVVWAFVNGELIDRVQTILKLAQIGTAPPAPAGPVYRRATVPAFMRDEAKLPQTATLNGATFELDMKEYRVEQLTGCYTSINSATRSRSSLREGDVVRIWYVREDGKWGIAAAGSRIPMTHLSEIVETEQAA